MKSNMEILDVGEVHIKRPQLLVTGGGGLVGSQISSDIKTNSSNDLRNPTICDELFRKEKPLSFFYSPNTLPIISDSLLIVIYFF